MSTTANNTATTTTPNEGDVREFDVVVKTTLVSDKFDFSRKQISFVIDTNVPTTDEAGNEIETNIVSVKVGQVLQATTDIDALQLLSALVMGGVPKKQIVSLLMMNAKVHLTKTFHKAGYIATDGKSIKHDVWATNIVSIEGHAPQSCLQFAWNLINSGDIIEPEPITAAAPTLQTTFTPTAPAV